FFLTIARTTNASTLSLHDALPILSKIWNETFLKAHPDPERIGATGNGPRSAWFTVAGLAAITVMIGLGAGPVMDYAIAASTQLIEAPAYLQLLNRGGE